MLDMLPGYGDNDTRGSVVITYKQYEFTKNAVKKLQYEVEGEHKVQDFGEVINARSRERYNFTEYEEGCRYWLSIVIGDWEDEGLVPTGSSDEVREALSKYWKDPSGCEERLMAQGTFRDLLAVFTYRPTKVALPTAVNCVRYQHDDKCQIA